MRSLKYLFLTVFTIYKKEPLTFIHKILLIGLLYMLNVSIVILILMSILIILADVVFFIGFYEHQKEGHIDDDLLNNRKHVVNEKVGK